MSLPHWLRSIDNGRIGEARTRAILIDRFWILERSVDIEGADFIVQRKIWGRNLLDERAPRLGYVQSKFAQDEATRLEIHSDYVLDSDKQPRDEFFLFVHTGVPGSETIYFFAARDIIQTFHKGADCFMVSMGDVKKLPDSQVHSTDYVLSVIEHALTQADFRKNRLFYHYLRLDDTIDTPIDHDFTLPLSNYWGDVVHGIQEIKLRTNTLIHDLEHDIAKLKVALGTSDPVQFMETFEFEHFYVLEDFFYRNSKYFDSEFYNVLVNHKKRVKLLRGRGLLQQFILLKSHVAREVEARIGKHKEEVEEYFCVEFRLRTSDLSILEVKDYGAKREKVVPPKPSGVQEFYGVINTDDTYTLYVRGMDVFSGDDVAKRALSYLTDKFDEVLLEQLFGEAELYG